MTPDPDDKVLLEFVRQFAGWKPGRGSTAGLWERPVGAVYCTGESIPDYLHDLNAWHKDVWPKILEIDPRGTFAADWVLKLDKVIDKTKYAPPYAIAVNADARARCLALWRALDGQLLGGTTVRESGTTERGSDA
jgi:hypothetical protein